ncbi:putative O-glycosylation ligase, exosortase A system-associated [Candidatus Berkiella cookevillensis]|uniref:O-Antigen ligase n=1 Tax=Candidatus Berkiella cookevillensis TaxID=437022 RepID=A0A0Q9YM18_9GAMM|nr:putative O-glycosylation ligase, exosortase A system-associated [Candidatus Berkiella cookevillensis]MCS5709122.1 putative O-glycosylation ligase, exosortase A system-associated [Candidatus Berkiella cookevillensis]
MRDLLVFAIVFSLLPLALIRTPIGVLLWNWIGFMNPHRLGWGSAFYFKFGAVIAATTMIGFIFSKDRKMIPMTPLVVALLCLIVWMNVTTYYALVPEDAFHQWKKVMKIQIFIFIALSCMQEQKRIIQLLWVITLSVAYFGIKGGIFTLMNGGNLLVLGPRGSQIEDNNTLALALIMVVPLMIYLGRMTDKKWLKWLLLVSTLLCGLSILGSHSRGALLAASAMLLFLVLKSQRRFYLGLFLALIIPVLVHFMPAAWFERMHTIQTYEQDASAMGRINAWYFAYNLAKDRPFKGGGFEAFRPGLFERYAPVPEDYHDAHSIYFEILGEQGFFGLLIFLSILALAWRTCQKTQKLSKNNPDLKWAHELVAMIQVSIIAYMVGGAFLGVAYFDLYYSLIAILILTHHSVVNSQTVLKQGVIPVVKREFRTSMA